VLSLEFPEFLRDSREGLKIRRTRRAFLRAKTSESDSRDSLIGRVPGQHAKGEGRTPEGCEGWEFDIYAVYAVFRAINGRPYPNSPDTRTCPRGKMVGERVGRGRTEKRVSGGLIRR
jgi:hypothetical protein